MVVKIKNLRLRTIIGIFDWERETKQEVVINIEFEFDGQKAQVTDSIEDTVDYKVIKKKVLAMVQQSNFFLIEKLADEIALIALADSKVERVDVSVDKPGALRFAKSVAVEISRSANG